LSSWLDSYSGSSSDLYSSDSLSEVLVQIDVLITSGSHVINVHHMDPLQ